MAAFFVLAGGLYWLATSADRSAAGQRPLMASILVVIWIYVNLSVGSARYESNDQRVKGLRAPEFLLAALALFILTVV